MERNVPRYPGKSGRERGPSRRSRNVPPPPADSARDRRLQITDQSSTSNPIEVRRGADPTQRTRQLAPPPRPAPPMPAIPQRAERREPGPGRTRTLETARTFRTPSRDPGTLIDVAMACAPTGYRFTVQFREVRAFMRTTYRYERTLTQGETEGANPAGLSIHACEMDWSNIKCPVCGSACGPILCGRCNSLVCEGRAVQNAGSTYFRCTDSCGASGLVLPNLTTIKGTQDHSGQQLLAPPAAMGRALPKRGGP